MAIRRLLALCLVVGTLAAACGGKSFQAPPTPGGGQIAGLLVEQRSDGSHRGPAGGERMGIYHDAFPPGGPVLQHPPAPVAITTTRSDGTFLFRNVPPGRYYVALLGQGHAASGKWAVVTSEQGASVFIVACTDCPIPL